MAEALYSAQVYENRTNREEESLKAMDQYIDEVQERQNRNGAGQPTLATSGRSSLPNSTPGILKPALESWLRKKTTVVYQLSQEKNLQKLQESAEKILKEDGLDKLDAADLSAKLRGKRSAYAGKEIIKRTAKLAGQHKVPEEENIIRREGPKQGTELKAGG